MATDKNKNPYNPKVTKEDKDILGDRRGNLRSDGGEDEKLKKKGKPVDFEGKNLDIPGRTLPENRNKKKLKDEENQLYSEDD